jgi:hypothetical protein
MYIFRKPSRRGNRHQDNLTDMCQRNRVSRLKFRVSLWCFIVVALIASTTEDTQADNARLDANALVRQMVAAYQSFQTLQESSETKFVRTNGAEFIQTTTLKYKRPNLIYAESRDPMQGTLIMSSNGRLATFYSGKQNAYTQRNAAPTFIGTLYVISNASKAMIGAPQNQILSPLSFLTAKHMPVEAGNYRYVKTEVIEGKRVALVAADADPNWLKTLFPTSTQITFQKRNVLLWIDTNTRLLVRESVDFMWTVEAGANPGSGRIRFAETHRNVIPNAPLRDEDFNIAPPKGAEEVFPAVR